MSDRLVWIDCEMTGLDLTTDALIEVAALVTDGELNVLGPGIQVVVRPPAQALAAMSDVVRAMHTTSGLLDELAGGLTMAAAEQLVLAYVREQAGEQRRAPLAGNTVHMDRAFLARDMPELEGFLHYRNVDVSSFKELVRRWYPRVYYAAPPKTGGHRALGDILDSLDELRYYRRTVLVEPPGPDSATSRTAAAEVVAARP